MSKPKPAPLPSGTVVGGYTVVKKLAAGGFGVVYLAAGHAVEGPVAEVITTETLSGLYGVPVEVLRASDGRLVVVGQPEPPAHHHDRHEHDHAHVHG